MILDAQGRPVIDTHERNPCDHGVTFDGEAARQLLMGWEPDSPEAFIAGPPGASEIRRRWPRLHGNCPKGCGFHGIAYASYEHYIAGDW
jgi:hypothetical protein